MSEDDDAPSVGRRCFLALLPDGATRASLSRNRESLERAIIGNARGVRWLEPAALHVTLRFLGASSDAQIERLQHALPTLAPALPPVPARRYGIWPNRARPRMLVLELHADSRLLQLAEHCEQLARDAGFAPETRGFRTHVTLAHLRPGCTLGIPPTPPMSLAFDTLALMASDLQPAGARYRTLAGVALPAAERS